LFVDGFLFNVDLLDGSQILRIIKVQEARSMLTALTAEHIE
jgi:hypothetical protein